MTYTTNIYITIFQDWVGSFGHFWTLAVEEQFYFFWPWLVLFAPKKWLVPALIAIISLAPPYRLFAYYRFPFDIGAMDFKAGTFILGHLDSLGIGALLAVAWQSNIKKETLQKYLTRVVLPIGLLIVTSTLLLFHYRLLPSVVFITGDLGTGMISAWLVSYAGFGFTGLVGKILEFAPFTYLGKISYGIYVYHNFMPLILIPIFGYLDIPLQVPGRINFLLSGLLTVVIASLSWHLVELPINNLKRHFQYAAKPTPTISQIQLTEGKR
jgi:peptidoglycan/LPS O-acetylase OafA/YrhL